MIRKYIEYCLTYSLGVFTGFWMIGIPEFNIYGHWIFWSALIGLSCNLFFIFQEGKENL